MGFLGVRLDDELEEKIKATGRPRSEVVRDALRAYFDVAGPQITKDQEVLVRELDRLLDEKFLKFNIVKQPSLNTVKQDSLNTVKPKQKPLNSVKHRPRGQSNEIIRQAARSILGCFDAGREPLNTEIADDVGVSVNSLGMYLKPTGIKAQPTGRHGIKGRYFTFDMRPQIEEILEMSEISEESTS